jgi:endonuclease/exonuclease/phosphatase family metal-dependent hydrolase
MKRIPPAIAIPFLCFFLVSCARCALPVGLGRGEVTIAAYNVNALFDGTDDGTEYSDYSVASGTWTPELYAMRLSNLADVVKACARGGPDVIALEELENPGVLSDLNRGYLKSCGYTWQAMAPARGAAINTGILSRLKIIHATAHALSAPGSEGMRNILEIEVETSHVNVTIFANHWKSKLGGDEETEPLRIEAASILKRRISEIAPTGTAVIVLGDLNENADEYERAGRSYPTALMPIGDASGSASGGSLLLATKPEELSAAPAGSLYDPWFGLPGEGSYWHGGRWETIDHILLSSDFFTGTGLKYRSFEPVTASFLLDGKGHPLAWNGKKRQGYSDHLPVVVHLGIGSER